MALGRGKVTRQAKATVRKGTGGAKGRVTSTFLWYCMAVAAESGSTVIPKPDATMWRMVSRELPSVTSEGDPTSARRVTASTRGGQDSST